MNMDCLIDITSKKRYNGNKNLVELRNSFISSAQSLNILNPRRVGNKRDNIKLQEMRHLFGC